MPWEGWVQPHAPLGSQAPGPWGQCSASHYAKAGLMSPLTGENMGAWRGGRVLKVTWPVRGQETSNVTHLPVQGRPEGCHVQAQPIVMKWAWREMPGAVGLMGAQQGQCPGPAIVLEVQSLP